MRYEMRESRKTLYTKRTLEDGLIELMKAKPFDKITVTELCAHCDINRSTFYMHYEDVYALLCSIEEDVLEWERQVISDLSGRWVEGRESTLRSMERLFSYFVENSKYLQVLMSERGDIYFQKRFFEAAYRMCDLSAMRGKQRGPLAEDPRFIFVVNGGVGLMQYWLKNGLKESPRAIAELVYDMALPLIHAQRS